LEEVTHMQAYLKWRNDQLDLADRIVHQLRLPLPCGGKIRAWDRYCGSCPHRRRQGYGEWEDAAIEMIREGKVFEDPPEGLGYKWIHPTSYLAAAISMAALTVADVERLVREAVEWKERREIKPVVWSLL
jgi:hypothetical protein